MGGQDEQVTLGNSIANDAMQNIANYCSISCNNNISNESITVIGGNATINLSQSCSAVGSECLVKNVVSSQISNLINNMVQQEESNLGIFSLLGPGSNESTNITNSIKNQVSQLISNTCQQDPSNTITGNTVFAQDANLKLNIGQTGNVNKAQCALDTVAKLVLNNTIQNTVKQTESSCKDLLAFLVVIIIIMILIILAPVLFAVGKRAGKIIGPKNK
jgi:hypothetical protein